MSIHLSALHNPPKKNTHKRGGRPTYHSAVHVSHRRPRQTVRELVARLPLALLELIDVRCQLRRPRGSAAFVQRVNIATLVFVCAFFCVSCLFVVIDQPKQKAHERAKARKHTGKYAQPWLKKMVYRHKVLHIFTYEKGQKGDILEARGGGGGHQPLAHKKIPKPGEQQ